MEYKSVKKEAICDKLLNKKINPGDCKLQMMMPKGLRLVVRPLLFYQTHNFRHKSRLANRS